MSEAVLNDDARDDQVSPAAALEDKTLLELAGSAHDTAITRPPVEVLMSGPYLHNILQDKRTNRATKTAALAVRTLDIAASVLEYNGQTWPDLHDFEQKYELANYLWQTRDEDESSILLEIINEAFEEAPELHQMILKLSEKLARQMKLYNEAQVADIMVKLWVVDEIEPDLPCSYEKAQTRAHARAVRPMGFTEPRQ